MPQERVGMMQRMMMGGKGVQSPFQDATNHSEATKASMATIDE
jgi:hypothetical protein